jgi:hypothetical protein
MSISDNRHVAPAWTTDLADGPRDARPDGASAVPQWRSAGVRRVSIGLEGFVVPRLEWTREIMSDNSLVDP